MVSQMLAASSLDLATLLTDGRADLRGAGVGVCRFLFQGLRAFLQPLGQIPERVVCVSGVDYGRRRRRRGFRTLNKKKASVGGVHQMSENIRIIC